MEQRGVSHVVREYQGNLEMLMRDYNHPLSLAEAALHNTQNSFGAAVIWAAARSDTWGNASSSSAESGSEDDTPAVTEDHMMRMMSGVRPSADNARKIR